jgi:hypothetical protein
MFSDMPIFSKIEDKVSDKGESVKKARISCVLSVS